MLELYNLPKQEIVSFNGKQLLCFADYLHKPIFRGTIFVTDAHNNARKVWELAHSQGLIPSKSTLLHIDAHDDLALTLAQMHEKQPVNIVDLNDSEGSFIAPSIINGLIKDVVCFTNPNSPTINFNEKLGYTGLTEALELETYYYPDSIRVINSQGIYPKISFVTDISALPPMKNIILDIDLDYFTADWNDLLSPILLKTRVKNFIKRLRTQVDPIITTIAVSKGWTKFGEEKKLLEAVLNGFDLPTSSAATTSSSTR